MHRKVQVADHLLDDPGLLCILLAEIGDIRSDDMKQLENHRRHPAKMPGPRGSLERVLEFVDLDIGPKSGGVDDGSFRAENQINSRLAANREILLQVARVTRKIFLRSKLGRIHKNGNHYEFGFRARSSDQARMAFMQRPHGGNQTDDQPGLPGAGYISANVFNGGNNCYSHDDVALRLLKNSCRYDRLSDSVSPNWAATLSTTALAASSCSSGAMISNSTYRPTSSTSSRQTSRA